MIDFRYYLNRQGPRGQQGVKGEQGYSPQVTVGKNTASEFTLKVINEDGSFETENLKAVPENRGGTYVRYDKDTYQEYIGDPDFASTERYGVVRLATKEDLETQEESLAVSSAILNTYLQENYLNKVLGDVVTGSVSFRGDTGFVIAPSIGKIKDENNNQYLTRNISGYTTTIGGLVIPDDDSTRLKQGAKEIAYTSDLTEFVTNATLNNAISNLVTTDTDQTITGDKTFNDPIIASQFNDMAKLIFETKVDNRTYRVTVIRVDERNPPSITIGDGYDYKLVLKGKSVIDKYDKKFLVQGSITAGSDNLAISETTDGVQITCNAPTNEQIEILQRLINDLSTKIDNLTTRLNNLEEVIDGGIA